MSDAGWRHYYCVHRTYRVNFFKLGLAMNRVIAALFVLVVTSVSAFAQSLPVPSYRKNQRGSEMKIYAIAPDGSFKGVSSWGQFWHAKPAACVIDMSSAGPGATT